MSRLITLVALVVLVCLVVLAPPGPPLPEPGTSRAKALEVPPPPRLVEDTRCYRSDSKRRVTARDYADPCKMYGVECRVKVAVRRLASTGRDVIDLHWSIKYVGRRPPL